VPRVPKVPKVPGVPEVAGVPEAQFGLDLLNVRSYFTDQNE